VAHLDLDLAATPTRMPHPPRTRTPLTQLHRTPPALGYADLSSGPVLAQRSARTTRPLWPNRHRPAMINKRSAWLIEYLASPVPSVWCSHQLRIPHHRWAA